VAETFPGGARLHRSVSALLWAFVTPSRLPRLTSRPLPAHPLKRGSAPGKVRHPMHIPEPLLEELWRHAEETYPSECCGFLLGASAAEAVDSFQRCVNQQDALHAQDPGRYPRTSRTAYTLSAQDIFFLDRSQRTPRPVRILYHSHNDTGAYFSPEDKAFALFAGEPAYPVDYLVIDVRDGRSREARLFRFDRMHADFTEAACYLRDREAS
jgi:[CysO sulfur-carrier protein]-S-L-cysteine hydrolase